MCGLPRLVVQPIGLLQPTVKQAVKFRDRVINDLLDSVNVLRLQRVRVTRQARLPVHDICLADATAFGYAVPVERFDVLVGEHAVERGPVAFWMNEVVSQQDELAKVAEWILPLVERLRSASTREHGEKQPLVLGRKTLLSLQQECPKRIRDELSHGPVDEGLEAEDVEQDGSSADTNLVERLRLREGEGTEPLGILIKVVEAVQLRASDLGWNEFLSHASPALHDQATCQHNGKNNRRFDRRANRPVHSIVRPYFTTCLLLKTH